MSQKTLSQLQSKYLDTKRAYQEAEAALLEAFSGLIETMKAETPKVIAPKAASVPGVEKDAKNPSLSEAIVRVLGDRVMKADQVYEALSQQGWLPRSGDPRKYVGHVLSVGSDQIVKAPEVGRGFYKVQGAAKTSTSILKEAGLSAESFDA